MNSVDMIKWVTRELSCLLEFDVGEEYSKNILKIETESELKEFISSLLDLEDQRNIDFFEELRSRLKKPKMPDMIVYRKPDLEEPVSKGKGKKQSSVPKEIEAQNKQIKKDKDINSIKSNLTSGNRTFCHCQAGKHKLVANCLKCGRIVCEIEGSGPCNFCGNLVCTKEEFDKIRSGSNKGKNLRDDLMKKNWGLNETSLVNIEIDEISKQLDMSQMSEKAVAHKEKLLDYDRTSAKRTQVIDDESDYFNTNSKWLNEEQRVLLEKKQEEVREKRFGSKIGKTFTLDFAGRKVIDDQKCVDLKDYEKEIEEIMKENKKQQNTVVNQDIECVAPIFIEEKSMKKKNTTTKDKDAKQKNENVFRLQDQALQEMKDDGMCLSMHQPWASMLVMGIKQHEGRTWYTPYRGRLWIHAGSKDPDDCDIKELESFYKILYSNHNIKFPDSYPTSCLLGYVDITDCVSSDIYRSQFPNGESESEFVFVCNNFRELIAKIPMSGQHKIYKLEKNIHSVAKKASVRYYDGDY